MCAVGGAAVLVVLTAEECPSISMVEVRQEFEVVPLAEAVKKTSGYSRSDFDVLLAVYQWAVYGLYQGFIRGDADDGYVKVSTFLLIDDDV